MQCESRDHDDDEEDSGISGQKGERANRGCIKMMCGAICRLHHMTEEKREKSPGKESPSSLICSPFCSCISSLVPNSDVCDAVQEYEARALCITANLETREAKGGDGCDGVVMENAETRVCSPLVCY